MGSFGAAYRPLRVVELLILTGPVARGATAMADYRDPDDDDEWDEPPAPDDEDDGGEEEDAEVSSKRS